MSLKVDIHKKYRGFSLDMQFQSDGEMLGILGASGSGKSLTLKCIAGIVTPDEGHIELNGRVLFDSAAKVNLKPQQRRVGYLFQNYALFPHMTVEQNILCVLRGGKHQKLQQAHSLLDRFELRGLGHRYPSQLSGGQQQRAALVRILAYEPEALLLDEPFSALDAHMREKLQVEMMSLLKEEYTGDTVMVTHSRDEVYRLTKNLMVLDDGRVLAMDGTKQLFESPRNYVAARLTGCKNISPAEKIDDTHVYAGDWGLKLEVTHMPEEMTHVGIRAHDFRPSVSCNDTNRIRFGLLNRMENPFDWSVMWGNADSVGMGEMWWIYSKELGIETMPEYLCVSPAHVLLLGGGQTAEDDNGT